MAVSNIKSGLLSILNDITKDITKEKIRDEIRRRGEIETNLDCLAAFHCYLRIYDIVLNGTDHQINTEFRGNFNHYKDYSSVANYIYENGPNITRRADFEEMVNLYQIELPTITDCHNEASYRIAKFKSLFYININHHKYNRIRVLLKCLSNQYLPRLNRNERKEEVDRTLDYM